MHTGGGGSVGLLPANASAMGDAPDMEAQGEGDLDPLANPLGHLRYHPQFLQLRQVWQQWHSPFKQCFASD